MKCFLKNKGNWGMAFFLLILLLLLLGEKLAPYPPNDVDMSLRLQPLSAQHLLGTDHLGRDILSRILAGAHTTVGVSLSALFACLAVGVPLGLIAGYAGGRLDWSIMRLVDASMMFPDYIVAIVLSGILGAGTFNLIIAIVAVKWFGYARLVRSIVMAEKSKEYIASARLSGRSAAAILYHHLIPHVASSVSALAVVDIGKIILMIASLSYIGLGIQPPNAEWGSMLNEGRSFFISAPYLMIVPGAAILMVVLLVNVFGAAFADRFDTSTQKEG